MRRIALRAILVLALLLACRGLVRADEPASWEGRDSAAGQFAVFVARDSLGWEKLWALVGRPPPSAAVEFSRQMAIGIFLGRRPTGGYWPHFEGVSVQEGMAVAKWSEHRPEPNSIVTQALTTPWLIQLVERSERPVLFREGSQVSLPSTEFERLRRAMAELVDRLNEREAGMRTLERQQGSFAEEYQRLKDDNDTLRRIVEDLENRLRKVLDAAGKP